MKIRCKNCYRILNKNEEYCTSCGEYSTRMHNAMVTGDFGPNPGEKFKLSLGIFLIAGFIVCGILQVVFAAIENKENGGNGFTSLFCQSNSLFYSSLLATLIFVLFFKKDRKDFIPQSKKEEWLGASLIAVFAIIITVLLSLLFKYTQIIPKFIVDYFKEGSVKFFDLKGACTLKIVIGSILSALCLEVVKKYLIDALDDTMLGDTAIFVIAAISTTIMELAWVMSLDIVICALIVNITTTGIYMYTNRNIVINLVLRVLLYVVAILVLFL